MIWNQAVNNKPDFHGIHKWITRKDEHKDKLKSSSPRFPMEISKVERKDESERWVELKF